MFNTFKKYRQYIEFFPIVLIGLLFITEAEMEKSALNMSCQLTITIVTVLMFFLIVMKFPRSKGVAFIVALVLWIVLVYVKKQYVPVEN